MGKGQGEKWSLEAEDSLELHHQAGEELLSVAPPQVSSMGSYCKTKSQADVTPPTVAHGDHARTVQSYHSVEEFFQANDSLMTPSVQS